MLLPVAALCFTHHTVNSELDFKEYHENCQESMLEQQAVVNVVAHMATRLWSVASQKFRRDLSRVGASTALAHGAT